MRVKAPATERNRGPILEVLRRVLPPQGLVLEIAAGTGEHAVYFARHLPGLIWQPTDGGLLDSIAAWREWAGLANLRPPLRLDVTELPWPVTRADAVFCANMIHIAPWCACEMLFAGVRDVLPAGAPLVLYGPFFRDDAPTVPSNFAFDADLRARDPAWGVRRLADVERLATDCGFSLQGLTEMPANNLTVTFRRRPG
ncbi:MAG TPA: DUF938 domain-containing protein [Woeseiaceae bacterium]|jgi:SAM-dependent methyltransferase|nr:DUF938 domain-containing protein [Woeseiaceae bacterium]